MRTTQEKTRTDQAFCITLLPQIKTCSRLYYRHHVKPRINPLPPGANMPCTERVKGATKGKARGYLDELDNGHLGVVALPGHGVQHSAVTTVAITVPLRARLEKGVDELLVVHVCHRLEARGEMQHNSSVVTHALLQAHLRTGRTIAI